MAQPPKMVIPLGVQTWAAERYLTDPTDPGAGRIRSRPSSPQPIAPVPGDLNPWSDVAKQVGIIIPGKFAAPAPAPIERSYPGLTAHTAKAALETCDASNPRKCTYSISNGRPEFFIHTLPAATIHGLDPSDRQYGQIATLPAAWPSAVGQAGTVVRIAANLVLTAYHVWSSVKSELNQSGVFIIFDFRHPEESPDDTANPLEIRQRDDGGWGRAVRQVGRVLGAVLEGPQGAGPYKLHEDWVILQIAHITGADAFPPWDEHSTADRYEVARMIDTDWYNGRRTLSRKPAIFEAFNLDPLAMIGHPLGVTTQIADGGDVTLANNALFQHDLDVLSGNSGSPIFRTALGNTAETWLVGIALSGRDKRHSRTEAEESSAQSTHSQLRPNENIALDIREVLRQVIARSDLELFGDYEPVARRRKRDRIVAVPAPAAQQRLLRPTTTPTAYGTEFVETATTETSNFRVQLRRIESSLAPIGKPGDATWNIGTGSLKLSDPPPQGSYVHALGVFAAHLFDSAAAQTQLTRSPGTDTFTGQAKDTTLGVIATLMDAGDQGHNPPIVPNQLAAGCVLHTALVGGAYAYVIDPSAHVDSLPALRQFRPTAPGFSKTPTTVVTFTYPRFAKNNAGTIAEETISKIVIKTTRISQAPGTGAVLQKSGGLWIGEVNAMEKPIEIQITTSVSQATIATSTEETYVSASVTGSLDALSILCSDTEFTTPTDTVIALDLAEISRIQPARTSFRAFRSATVTVNDPKLIVVSELDAGASTLYSSCVVPPPKADKTITFKFAIVYTVVPYKGKAKDKTAEFTLTLIAKPPAP